jgi:tetratricopeptide (TPR) repeat protein
MRRTISSKRTLVFVAVLFLRGIVCSSQAIAAPYDDAVEKAFGLFQGGKFAEAAAQALEAIQLDNTRYDAHFVGGLALYKMDQLDLAATYFQKALERAPQEQKAKVQEALQLTVDKSAFLERLRAADEAEQAGLIAKAAREYTAAWDSFKVREDIGLKAARLWTERLNEPIETTRILNYIVAHPQDLDLLKQAKELLQAVQPALQRVFVEQLGHGNKSLAVGNLDEALQAFIKASQAQPNQSAAHIGLARVYAKQNRVEEATNALGQALRAGPVKVDDIFTYTEFAPLMSEPKFRVFVSDAWGADSLSTAVTLAQKNSKKAKLEAQKVAGVFLVSQAGDGDYQSIQAAVNNASSGMRIIVKPGRYDEHVQVRVPLSIEGDGPVSQVVVRKFQFFAGFKLSRVSSGTVQIGDYNYKKMADSSKGSIVDCIFGPYFPEDERVLVIWKGTGITLTIRNCRNDGGQGLLIGPDNSVTIENCELLNSWVGIRITECSVTVRGCRIYNTEYPLIVDNRDSGSSVYVENSIFTNNKLKSDIQPKNAVKFVNTKTR